MTRPKPPFDEEVASLLTFSGDAECRKYDPGMFDTDELPARSNAQKAALAEHIDRAREVCLDCPAMIRCLEHGILFRKRDAIYGGMTDAERDAYEEQHPELVAA